ncbi:MAG: sigma-70 family RNA polymerase sigma factor [Ruminococcaceae bacterium]|nr:sigma-70 family RNA polymerase sigma factor [Oscillospiraceae bacterium]
MLLYNVRGVDMDSIKNAEVNELIDMVRGESFSDEAFAELIERYSPLLKKRIATYFGVLSAEESEFMQEASIALHSAAMTYDSGKCDGVTFGLYASVCVTNRLKSLLRKRLKDLDKSDDYLSLEKVASGVNVENSIVTRDVCDRVMREAKELLSDFEYEVFRLSFERYTTKDIAESLGKSAKSIDNAKFRISKSLRESKTIREILSEV